MIRIALADNYRPVREIWHYILSAKTDFEVVAKCADGQEAIEAASVYSPDLFIMDINMHPVNGIEATGIITGRHPGIQIIAMAIHPDAAYVKRMLAAGAHGYVTKNSSYMEMINAIGQVLAGNYYICNEVQMIMPGLLIDQY
jgi:DNA-binding NarL/FixJ family response regulator